MCNFSDFLFPIFASFPSWLITSIDVTIIGQSITSPTIIGHKEKIIGITVMLYHRATRTTAIIMMIIWIAQWESARVDDIYQPTCGIAFVSSNVQLARLPGSIDASELKANLYSRPSMNHPKWMHRTYELSFHCHKPYSNQSRYINHFYANILLTYRTPSFISHLK